MPSRVPTVQVRYADPRINRILDVLVRTAGAPSKSKLVETLSVEPIMHAFGTWIAKRIKSGTTYSELHAETRMPVPDLMALAEPEMELDATDIARHLEAIAQKTGIDMTRLWAEAPAYELEPT